MRRRMRRRGLVLAGLGLVALLVVLLIVGARRPDGGAEEEPGPPPLASRTVPPAAWLAETCPRVIDLPRQLITPEGDGPSGTIDEPGGRAELRRWLLVLLDEARDRLEATLEAQVPLGSPEVEGGRGVAEGLRNALVAALDTVAEARTAVVGAADSAAALRAVASSATGQLQEAATTITTAVEELVTVPGLVDLVADDAACQPA